MPRQKTLRVTSRKFGRAYRRAKDAEKQMKALQKELFEALTRDLERTRRLPRRTIHLHEHSLEEVKRDNPGWRVIHLDEDQTTITLERDPNLIDHHYVNLEDGMVYRRGTPEDAPSLDDERLQRSDPDLWQAITKPIRIIKDPTEWTDEQRKAVEPYLIPGMIKTRLVPPRKATPEELDEASSI